MIAQFTVLFEINYMSNVQNNIWLRLMLFWTLLVLVNCAITYANRCDRHRQFILGVYYYDISCAARTSVSPVVLPLGSETIATFARGKGLIFLDNVDCIGTELRLTNCTNLGVGVHNCRHVEDAGVVCSGMQYNVC